MAETRQQKIKRWRSERARRWKQNKAAKARIRANTKRIERINLAIKKALAAVPGNVPNAVNGWHPGATRVPYSALAMDRSVPAKGVLHTTEGYGLPSYAGSNPTFTLVLTGPGYLRPKLYQHIPLGTGAKALKHTRAQATNTANATQIELGNAFAGRISQLKDQDYRAIADLMRFIEKNAGVPRRTGVRFTVPAARLSDSEWRNYGGWLGHAHVPQNDHWDPGAFDIHRVL